VRLLDFTRTTTFRWTLAVAGAFVLGILVLFAFVYWQAAEYLTSTVDRALTADLRLLASDTPERRLAAIEARLRTDSRRVRVAGLFGSDGQRIAGNFESVPPGLVPDIPAYAVVVRIDGAAPETRRVRLAAHVLPGGEVLVLGRGIEEIGEIADIVGGALLLSLLPAIALAISIGAALSLRAHNLLSEVNSRIKRIVAGDLRERLPTLGRGDLFDQLAVSVNGMLDEIESLIHEIAGVGDDIAHDLRTPLTRARIRLERGRERATTLEELRLVADKAIVGLDQSLAIITALLRITEIEHSRRLAAFSNVPLAALVREVGDLYEPMAEDKGVVLAVEVANEAIVHCDRDLLFEAVANLVDNAVKFTPEGGRVEIDLLRRENESVIRVRDSGPGIPADEHQAVTKRFYRSDKSRATGGLGLGLSLVAAIVKLHGFRFAVGVGPGCTAEITCSQPH
jgi:signal transduction histidine kinase